MRRTAATGPEKGHDYIGCANRIVFFVAWSAGFTGAFAISRHAVGPALTMILSVGAGLLSVVAAFLIMMLVGRLTNRGS